MTRQWIGRLFPSRTHVRFIMSSSTANFIAIAMSIPSQAAHSFPIASQPLAGFACSPNMSAPTDTIDLTGSAPNPPNEDTTSRRTSQGTKRKSTSNNDEEDVNLSDIDVDGMPITENADQVRRKIARLIENDGMNVRRLTSAATRTIASSTSMDPPRACKATCS